MDILRLAIDRSIPLEERQRLVNEELTKMNLVSLPASRLTPIYQERRERVIELIMRKRIHGGYGKESRLAVEQFFHTVAVKTAGAMIGAGWQPEFVSVELFDLEVWRAIYTHKRLDFPWEQDLEEEKAHAMRRELAAKPSAEYRHISMRNSCGTEMRSWRASKAFRLSPP